MRRGRIGVSSPTGTPPRVTLLRIEGGLKREMQFTPDVARAVLEATAFQTKEVVDAMYSDTGIEVNTLKVDGGMVVNDLLMQFQSDILNVEVVRPKVSETTALGAAYLAGLAEGVWASCDDITANWVLDTEVAPAASPDVADVAYARWLRAVERSRSWAPG